MPEISATDDSCDVLIVGGGMAGLACALAMHKEGLSVKVFERAPVLGEVGAGINVTPWGVEVLEELGLGAALPDPEVGCGVATETLRYYNPDGVLIYTDPRGKNAGYAAPQYSMHRGKLQTVILRAVRERLGDANLLCNHTLTAYTTEAEKQPAGCNVTCNFETIDGQPLPSFSGRVLLGCDGIKSAVREQLYPDEPARFTGWRIYRAVVDLECPMLDGRTMLLVGDKQAAVAMYGISDAERAKGKTMLNMGWAAHDTAFDNPAAPKDAINAKESWTAKVPKSHMSFIYDSWKFAEGVFGDPSVTWRSILEAAPEITCFALYDRDPVTQWTFGPVTLVGDAAHPLLPFGSQGANQAFLDAKALGQAVREGKDGEGGLPGALKRCARPPQAPPSVPLGCRRSAAAALRRYEELRCEAAGKVVMENRKMGPTKLLRAMDEGCGGKSVEEQEAWVAAHADDMTSFITGYHSLTGGDAKKS